MEWSGWGRGGEGLRGWGGWGKKGGDLKNKETYIDSFPGKLDTAMLGKGGGEWVGKGGVGGVVGGGVGERGRGKGGKKRRRLKCVFEWRDTDIGCEHPDLLPDATLIQIKTRRKNLY